MLKILDIITPRENVLILLYDIVLIFIFFRFFKFIYTNFIRKPKNLIDRYGKNSYVLITGATDGIGKQYCFSFAERNFNLIMVSRNMEKLLNVKKEILLKYNNIDIITIQYDFSKKTSFKEYNDNFGNNLQTKYDISVLINNVGISHEDYFKTLDLNNLQSDYNNNSAYTIHDYLNVNCLSQTILTKLFMHKMDKRSKKCAIITMSSIAANVYPYTGNAIYSATKAYNDFLSRALYGEYNYERGNIDFLSVKPSYVESNMSQMKADGFDCITAKKFVDSTLSELGYTCHTVGHICHKVQALIVEISPDILRRYFFKSAKIKEEKLQARHQNKKSN